MALGCQQTVQTFLEREISSTAEVANPNCSGFCEAAGNAANYVTSESNNYWREGSNWTCDGRKGGTAEQENDEKVEYQKKKWQEQVVSKAGVK